MPASTVADRMRLELEGRDDAEVAAAAAYRPEEIVVLASAGADEAAVGKHDFCGEQIVEREAVLAHEPAQSTAEGEARNAGDRDEAAGSGEAVGLERVVHLAPVAAALARGPCAPEGQR